MTVGQLIEKLRALPQDYAVEAYTGDTEVNVVHVDADDRRVLLMERPFDVGDPATLWREWFEAGRAKESP